MNLCKKIWGWGVELGTWKFLTGERWHHIRLPCGQELELIEEQDTLALYQSLYIKILDLREVTQI